MDTFCITACKTDMMAFPAINRYQWHLLYIVRITVSYLKHIKVQVVNACDPFRHCCQQGENCISACESSD